MNWIITELKLVVMLKIYLKVNYSYFTNKIYSNNNSKFLAFFKNTFSKSPIIWEIQYSGTSIIQTNGDRSESNYQIVWITKKCIFHTYYKQKKTITYFLLNEKYIALYKLVHSMKYLQCYVLILLMLYTIWKHKLHNFLPQMRLDYKGSYYQGFTVPNQ